MYSEFGLEVNLDKSRRLTDLNSAYRIKLARPIALVISFYKYSCNFL